MGGFVLHVVKNFAKRDATLGSCLAAVFVFRGDARLPAGEGRDFHPDPAVFGFHGLASPGQGVALNVLTANSESGTFVKKEVLKGVGVLRFGKDLDKCSGAPFLHLGGNDRNVEGTGIHQLAGQMPYELGGFIVEIGFQLNQGFGEKLGGTRRVAKDQSQDVGDLEIIAARPVSDCIESEGRDGAEAVSYFRENGRPGWGHQLRIDVGSRDRASLHECKGSGCGQGDLAVCS